MPSHESGPSLDPTQDPARNAEMPSVDFIQRAAGDDLPVQLLWALAYHESSFRPWLVNQTSHATGAWQITKPVLIDYNKAHGSAHALEDMKRPELAVLVAAWLLRRVVASWNAASVALKADFGSSRYLSLLVLGWNSGPNAVLRLTKALEAAGVASQAITVDLLHRAAIDHGVPSWIAKPERVAWAKQVAATFADLRSGRKAVVATLVQRPDGEAQRRVVLEKVLEKPRATSAPSEGHDPSAPVATGAPGAPGQPGGGRETSHPDGGHAYDPALRPDDTHVAVSEASASGLGEAMGAGLALAVLGLGGAAAVQASGLEGSSEEMPR